VSNDFGYDVFGTRLNIYQSTATAQQAAVLADTLAARYLDERIHVWSPDNQHVYEVWSNTMNGLPEEFSVSVTCLFDWIGWEPADYGIKKNFSVQLYRGNPGSAFPWYAVDDELSLHPFHSIEYPFSEADAAEIYQHCVVNKPQLASTRSRETTHVWSPDDQHVYEVLSDTMPDLPESFYISIVCLFDWLGWEPEDYGIHKNFQVELYRGNPDSYVPWYLEMDDAVVSESVDTAYSPRSFLKTEFNFDDKEVQDIYQRCVVNKPQLAATRSRETTHTQRGDDMTRRPGRTRRRRENSRTRQAQSRTRTKQRTAQQQDQNTEQRLKRRVASLGKMVRKAERDLLNYLMQDQENPSQQREQTARVREIRARFEQEADQEHDRRRAYMARVSRQKVKQRLAAARDEAAPPRTRRAATQSRRPSGRVRPQRQRQASTEAPPVIFRKSDQQYYVRMDE